MANITLKIDDQILEKARRLAIHRNTSINAIVRKKKLKSSFLPILAARPT